MDPEFEHHLDTDPARPGVFVVSSVTVHTKDEEGVVLHLIGGFVAEVVVPPEAVALGVDRGEVAFGVSPESNGPAHGDHPKPLSRGWTCVLLCPCRTGERWRSRGAGESAVLR